MTLRARLMVGLLFIIAALGAAIVTVGTIYRSSLTDQLDQRLDTVSSAAPQVLLRSGVVDDIRDGGFWPPGDVAGEGAPDPVTDIYLAIRHPDGNLQTVLAPVGDAEVMPVVAPPIETGTYATVETTGGAGDRMRVHVLIVESSLLVEPVELVIGVSTADVEASYRELRNAALIALLAVVAVLGLVGWWVVRLGVRPIQMMTVAADAITAGRTDERVPSFPGGTEAARLARALNTMIESSQATEARLRRFVADASHELRTPLTTLRGYTALHSAGGLRDESSVADAMRRIGSEAARMGMMVDDLLVLAELDEQRPLNLESIDLAALLGDLASDARIQQPERPIHVHVDAGLSITADRALLTQAVAALIANALGHTTIDAEVRISALDAEESVTIGIADWGNGIAPEHSAHLFERFYRADPARSRIGGGSGLGLSIVQNIAAAHGAEVGVESAVGVGTTFRLVFPR